MVQPPSPAHPPAPPAAPLPDVPPAAPLPDVPPAPVPDVPPPAPVPVVMEPFWTHLFVAGLHSYPARHSPAGPQSSCPASSGDRLDSHAGKVPVARTASTAMMMRETRVAGFCIGGDTFITNDA